MAEWQLRGTPNIPVPLIYTVDLRYFLTPPVSATGCTNPVGLATYLAEIDRKTGVVDLARDIAETFQADLSDGVIQQSRLHFSPQYVGNAPGLPDVVLLSDNGLVPPVRTPPGSGSDQHPRRAVLRRQCRNRDLLHPDLRRAVERRVPLARAGAGKVDRDDTFAAVRDRRAARRKRRQLTGPKA